MEVGEGGAYRRLEIEEREEKEGRQRGIWV
jgi:hypothetical protein